MIYICSDRILTANYNIFLQVLFSDVEIHISRVFCVHSTLSTRLSCERIAFQFSKICCSVVLDALASKSVMF